MLQLTYQPEPQATPKKDRSVDQARKKQARKEIRKWLREYKQRGCSTCSERRVATLDFHHLDQSLKSIEINEAIRMRWSKASIEREIAKCILICANCHRCEHEDSSRVRVGVIDDSELYDNRIFYAAGTRS